MKVGGKDGEAEGGQQIEEERDFFQRELDNMGWGFENLAVGEDVAFGEEAPGANGTGDEQWEQGVPTAPWHPFMCLESSIPHRFNRHEFFHLFASLTKWYKVG
jgi:hypothetical protein